ncbi:MAG: shikimate kinase [Planctomycetota bacterium]|jgi:XRE family aerobic/anaerobic benzoate catabolism transcriptional regulator
MAPDPDPTLLRRIAARVKTRRGELGWTMAEAAEQAGLSPRFYAQVEAAQANIAIGRLDALARALQMPLVSLLEMTPKGSGALESAPQTAPPLGIALLGIRGSGKSTLGASLAASMNLPFLELDQAIEERAGLALSELFALHGESYYRRLGGEVIEQLIAEGSPFVVALPGGIVLDTHAFEMVADNFTTVWLRTEPEDCMNRVLAQGDHRPMEGHADAMAELRKLLAAREPYYRRASLTLDTSSSNLEQTQEHLLRTVRAARRIA